MKRLAVLLSVLIFNDLRCPPSHGAEREPKYKIAIIDTGYNPDFATTKLKLCKTGHYDFRANVPKVGYTQLHGTAIASIIAEQLKTVDYCALIYQVETENGKYPIKAFIGAAELAKKNGATLVNISFQNTLTSITEREALKDLATQAIIFVSAGNEHKDLDQDCSVFPACFDIPNLYSVGALDPYTGKHASYSNFGKRVRLWFNGRTTLADEVFNGTSISSPRALAALVLRMEKKK